MSYRARVLVRINLIVGAAAVALTAILVVVFVVLAPADKDQDQAAAAVSAFAGAWAAADFTGAGRATDAPGDAATALKDASDRLAVTAIRVAEQSISVDGDQGTGAAALSVTATLAGLGDWQYRTSAPLLRSADNRWVVHWSPAVIHPKLTQATRLGRQRHLPGRAPILDGDGRPIVTERPVVTIGIWPSKLTDPGRAYDVIGNTLDVDIPALRSRVAKAPQDQFVDVITLRKSEAARAAAALRDVPGVIQRDGTWPLAPTREFARAVLGTVAPATAETLQNAGPTASPADLVGASGLQSIKQKQLAGAPGGKVLLVDRKTGDPVETLHEFTGTPGKPLATTLDREVQEAAEKALAGVKKPAALVAVQASTGKILAVANGPGAEAQNRAFEGRYPPGSTFKVVTTAALLGTGLSPADPVVCPETVTVQGKTFENQDTFALGKVPFREDFAHSCNTAFIGLRDRLGHDALPKAAAQFGLGGNWQVGMPAFTGSVPAAADDVNHAADMIGQGKVLVSPLAMAGVAATVAAGGFHQPYLIEDGATRFRPAQPVPSAIVKQLRPLMRAVVTGGSGSALGDLPGEPAAKTGTAEFGNDRPPRTHAWMIGFRRDLAFAVLLEDGGTGGRNAGPVAARFLAALPAS